LTRWFATLEQAARDIQQLMNHTRDEGLTRRAFLRFAGMGGIGLPALLAARAANGASDRAFNTRERTALIVVWLQGGASHLETYDPKPGAPAEVRGPYGAIETSAPGVRISELLPKHAQVADRFAILRSLVHTGFCHQQGNQQLFTGFPEQVLKLEPEHPDLFAVASRIRAGDAGTGVRDVPVHVGLNPIPYLGPAYLGPAFGPFAVYGDPNQPQFDVPELGLRNPRRGDHLARRRGLSDAFDAMRWKLEDQMRDGAFDRFAEQAFTLLTSEAARSAFDIDREDPRLRDKYGRNRWGQQCLLARRLVEAGVDLVTTTLDGPLCGRVGNWDDHAVNHHIFDAMKTRCQYMDQAVAALIEDLFDRGLDHRVMVVVTGEFGRTPKIDYQNDSASGVRQPGRDHWPKATSLLFAGGAVRGGQVIGGTDRLGAEVVSRRVGVRDVLATIYAHLGIDARSITIADPTNRPIAVLPEGDPIPELAG
jgi:uncharacterized protein (DUF1501 family)